VAGVVSYDAATKTATLNPASDLAAGVTYTATIAGGAGGVTDEAGNPLAQSKVWTFTVAAATTPPPAGATIAADTFSRTLSGSWGSATTGGTWTLGTPSSYSVGSGVGSVAVPANSVQRVSYLGSTSARDVDVKVDATFGAVSGLQLHYLLVRRQSTGEYLRVGLVGGSGKLTIRGQTSSAVNVFGETDTGLGFAANTPYTLRVQVQGASPTTIRAKAWKTGTTEPSAWNVQATSSAGPQTAGAIGLRLITSSTSSTTIKTDNLTAVTLP
jgi:hypothetical protein